MKKWIVAASIAFIAVIIVVVIGIFNLGNLIKGAVNSKGSEITGTELRVGDVDIALFTGRVRIQDFLLGNPAGYETPYALSVKAIEVDVDEKSLAGDTVVIDRIEVIAPDIVFEKSRRGDNFKALLRNVQKATGSTKASSASSAEGRDKKLLIREFVLRAGKVKLAVKGLQGRELTATLPEIRLQDIGGDQKGVSPAVAAMEVFGALYAKMTSSEMKVSLQKGLSGLPGDASETGAAAGGELGAARDRAVKEVESVKDAFGGLSGK
jgi:uncharacterized protein involved in outer membrane biogenesis